MNSFSEISLLIVSLFSFWALSLCLADILNLIFTIRERRYWHFAFALVLLAPIYFAWQVLFDYILESKTGSIQPVSEVLFSWPWLIWLAAFLLFTAFAAILLAKNIHHGKNNVTPNSIKSLLDAMPCGVLCYLENGRVLFSNPYINRLCESLTGSKLLSGTQFKEAIKEEIMPIDGGVYRFSFNRIEDGDRAIYEIIASDISSEYTKTLALEKDKAELSRINKELNDYNLGMDELIRHQEILQAKINIHDEMNRLMLSTLAIDASDEKALDDVFSLWERNASLLRRRLGEDEASDLEDLAKALGIELIYDKAKLSSLSEEERSLFFHTARESLANAAKHGRAKKLSISFSEKEIRFSNDGLIPAGEIAFTGGLNNLSYLAKKHDTSLSYSIGEEFTLILGLSGK